jgi:hypothetical protein
LGVVFIVMDLGLIIKANIYWDSLSEDDRVKFLQENHFWEGLKTYHHEFIPEDVKTLLLLKMEENGLK